MRANDLISLSLSALWQQKARTVMTTLGVIFGSFVLAASLSVGQGVQQAIRFFSRGNDYLRRVEAYSDFDNNDPSAVSRVQVQGKMSESRRRRIQRYLSQETGREGTRVKLTQEMIRKLRALPHVEQVIPLSWERAEVSIEGDRHLGMLSIGIARPADEALQARVIAGRYFERPDEPSVVLSEILLYRWGIKDEASMQQIVGKKVRLESQAPRKAGFRVFLTRPDGTQANPLESIAIEKIVSQLPFVLDKLGLDKEEVEVLRRIVQSQPASQPDYRESFTVIGVIRPPNAEEQKQPWDFLKADGDLLLPYETAANYYFKVPGRQEAGMDRVILFADSEDHVKELLEDVRNQGLGGRAPLEYLKRQRVMYLLIFGAMTFVAVVALLVAALGIANTMLINVLERTREIGIMKAVGADSRHLQLIFLVEGALIGCVGGALGLLGAWLASIPGDGWIRRICAREMEVDLKQSVFVFPSWLILSVLLFAPLVTILAAVYPSRRAAQVDPVVALRHE